eukprot:487712_1
MAPSSSTESLEECGREPQRRELYDLLDRSVSSLENVSALLIGYSGVGKSMVLRHVFGQLREKHGSDSFLEVYLNGHFHADETAAMRTICRKLDAKYSEDIEENLSTRSFSDRLLYLRKVLEKTKEKKRPVVFVLDHFELFASRSKQTLLYNMFDMLQSGQALIAVIGLTTQQDVNELLEKRIRSRFSHRRIVFTNDIPADTSLGVLQRALTLPSSPNMLEYHKTFNLRTEKLINHKVVRDLVANALKRGNSQAWINQMAMVALDKMKPQEKYLSSSHFRDARRAMANNYRLEAVKGLSVCELVILFAAVHLEFKQKVPFTFAMIWDEYETALRTNVCQSLHEFTGRTALKFFERLIDRGFLSFVTKTKENDMFASNQFHGVRLTLDATEL